MCWKGAEDPVITFIEDVEAGNQADWPALQGPHNLQNARAAVAPPAQRSGWPMPKSPPALPAIPACRIAWSASRRKTACFGSMTARPPTPTARRRRWRRFRTPIGSPVAGQGTADLDLSAVMPHLGNVRAAYLIGEAAPLFAPMLAPHLPVTLSGTLGRAVTAAAAAAKPGDTVLLSPACASFDQFRDFEARGDAFRALVEAL
jgi:UDP-N-acetylmuramoylalanine--D-glutamate ligase